VFAFLLLLSTAAGAIDPPPNGVEIPELRTRTATHFALPDGHRVAIVSSVPVHYRDADGRWQNIDLRFRQDADGDDVVDGNALILRSGPGGIAVSDQLGRGVLWQMSRRPDLIDGSEEVVDDNGLQWHYRPVRAGVKAEAVVSSARGPQTYSFPYALIGGADDFTIDADGNAIIGGVLTVPRAQAYGADGNTYDPGPWAVAPGPSLQLVFDDSSLPAAAYPYRLDPTTTLPAVSDGGYISGSSSTYATARSTSTATVTGSYIRAGQEYYGS